MKILFFHPNMPGQYKLLAPYFAQNKDNEVVFLTKPKPNVNFPNVRKVEFEVKRDAVKETHRYLVPTEKAVISSQEVWRVCKKLKQEGFIPDVIVGHLGWGDGMFFKDIFPDSPILSFMEFFYSANGADINFLPGDKTTPDDAARLRVKNLMHLDNLTNCDWGITPTYFQLHRHPEIFHQKISVLHDGIDTDKVKPDAHKRLALPNGITLSREDEVVTYISRNFEPYRGFPQFMKAAEKILKDRPNCHIVMIGQDGISYGKGPEGGKTYRQQMMEECNIDESRFHFLGYVAHEDMVKVMQISSAHIYLTVPFVLSWSMMEAMSAGCVMIGSNTAPVLEVLEHEKNGLVVDFFDIDDIANNVSRALDNKTEMQTLRDNARQTILDRYSFDKTLPLHVGLITDLAEGKTPPPTAKKIEEFNKDIKYVDQVKQIEKEVA